MSASHHSLPRLLALNAYGFSLAFLWNSLHVIVLPVVVAHLAPADHKNTTIGLLTFAGLVVAMLVQPLAGRLSDRVLFYFDARRRSLAVRRTPARPGAGVFLGRRRPWILLGTAVDLIFLGLLAWSGGLAWVVVGYVGLQLSSNLAHAANQGLLPEVVTVSQLGTASGVKTLLEMSGLVLSSLLMGRLVSPETRHPFGAIMVVALVLWGGAAIVTRWITENPPSTPLPLQPDRVVAVNLGRPGAYTGLILSRFFYLAGVYGIQAFGQYYIRDVLAIPNAVRLTGDLLAALTLALLVFAAAGGWLCDRMGHRRVLMLSSLIGATGCLLLAGARSPAALLAFGGLLGVGIGLFMTANWALASRLAPPGQSGQYLGLTNLATAGAAAFSRLEGPLIDLLNLAHPGAWFGYSAMFLLGTFFIVASSVLLFRIHEN